jgi:hypothetical protein
MRFNYFDAVICRLGIRGIDKEDGIWYVSSVRKMKV